ncbi:MAG: MATE family efflux transporter [Clostridia bacterium]|nr:MATE family efflux transporter [Clostridia bacterium]
MKRKNFEMDMTTGNLPKKILAYALPFIATGTLQLLFNTADVIVVGRFAGVQALAAVGSTSSLINLMINLFMGLSVGVSVLVSQYYGAGNHKGAHQTVHTAILVSGICGFAVGLFGLFASRALLQMMDSPPDVIELATLYLRIYFCGTPFLLLYNFGAAILRAVGDTRRPLFFLGISGLVNVILNVILVTAFHLGVAGVAIATVVSHILSAMLILLCLHQSSGSYHLSFTKLTIYKDKLLKMIRIGLPDGIQGSLFSISNVLIQSTINSFGSVIMAANTAAQNIEGFTYTAMNSISQTALAFTGQNIGGKKYKNLKTVLICCSTYVTLIGLIMGGCSYIFSEPLLGIFNSDPVVIQAGTTRLLYICVPYFLIGLSEVFVGMLRGMGYSMLPMLISVGGICLLRVVWIYTVFVLFPTLASVYISYPISWTVTAIIQAICLLTILHKFSKHSKEGI